MTIKFNRKKKLYYSGIIIGIGNGFNYPIRISKTYKNLKENYISDIDYRLIKEINGLVYNNIINQKDINLKVINVDNKDKIFGSNIKGNQENNLTNKNLDDIDHNNLSNSNSSSDKNLSNIDLKEDLIDEELSFESFISIDENALSNKNSL